MRGTLLAAVTAALAIAVVGTAQAASKPTVSTGGSTARTQTSATLHATVNPQGQATSFYFQYGTSVAYGAQTGPAAAGAGTAGVKVAAPVTGLTPNTTYHYRVVAINATGTTVGADKTLTTAKQPLGLTLLATPNPTRFAGPVTLAGTLSGTGNAGKSVQLMANAFPYTTGFQNVGNPQVVGPTGAFSFPILSLSTNTQFRVVTTTAPVIRSPIVTAGSAAIVRTAIGSHTPRAGSHVRFAGSVSPREDGALYAIQKQRGDTWVTVAGSSLRHYTETSSRYAINVRIAHSGVYRVFVGVADGAHVSASGTPVTIKVRPRHRR